MKIVRNMLRTLALLTMSTVFCLFLRPFATTGTYAPLIYVLTVFFVSRFTEGYFYGIFASIVAVVGVNYIFTFPYFAMDFTLTGYPLTFVIMITVSIMVSALMTRIKKQEQIRLEAERENMRANLLRAVSHDIRTPLTSIAGAASGIIENHDILSEDQKYDLVLNIREEAQWLVRMVENLLSITRINDGRTRITKQDELVEEIVGAAVVKFSKRFPEIEVQAETPEEVVMVPMDAILIEQVLINLMENAVIHGKTTTKMLVSAHVENDQMIFSVKDNGNGIEPHVLPKIFDGQFVAETGEIFDNKRNMGIGLSVCKSIVKAHHGQMRASNNTDRGACIEFALPLGEDNYDAD